jgi:hypothetical protein
MARPTNKSRVLGSTNVWPVYHAVKSSSTNTFRHACVPSWPGSPGPWMIPSNNIESAVARFVGSSMFSTVAMISVMEYFLFLSECT